MRSRTRSRGARPGTRRQIGLEPDLVVRVELDDLHGVAEPPDHGPQRAQQRVQPGRAVDRQRLLAPAQVERLDHPDQPEPVVEVIVGQEDRVELRQPHGAQQLLLRALSAVEQHRSPPARSSSEGSPRRAVGTEPAVPAKNSDRSITKGPRIGCPAMDTAELVAIDVHTHVLASVHGGGMGGREAESAGLDQRSARPERLTVPELAAYYRERKMACVAFTVDKVDAPLEVSNEEIAELAARRPTSSSRSRASIPRAARRASRWRGASSRSTASAGSSSTRASRSFSPRPAVLPALRGHRRARSCRRSSTPGTRRSAPASRAAAGSA